MCFSQSGIPPPCVSLRAANGAFSSGHGGQDEHASAHVEKPPGVATMAQKI